MKILLIIIFIFALTAGGAFAQKRRAPMPRSSARILCKSDRRLIDPEKPTAFLSFVRKERITTPDRGGRDADYLLFTLTNNSCWPIWLQMSGTGDSRFGDARLYFEVREKLSGKTLTGSLVCHVCSINPLGSGKTIIFSVPSRDADRGAVMRIAYEFEWERRASAENSNTLHTVAYYFSGLPESIFPK